MRSPRAAKKLLDAIGDGLSAFSPEAEDMMGGTDCPNHCCVEPDGRCPHGYESAGLTAGMV